MVNKVLKEGGKVETDTENSQKRRFKRRWVRWKLIRRIAKSDVLKEGGSGGT